MKNLMVFLMAVTSIVMLLASVSAATSELTSDAEVEIDGIDADGDVIGIEAGETIPIEVVFTSDVDASDVRIRAELNGIKLDVSDTYGPFDVEEGRVYKKVLSLKLPHELQDELSDDIELDIEIWNGDYETQLDEITLRVQRPSYETNVISIENPNSVEAGEVLPVTVILKNIGYNDLDDVFATVAIPALGIQQTIYYGDIIAVECCEDDDDEDCCDEDDEDTVVRRVYLDIPYEAKEGIYALEVEVKNNDLIENAVKEVVIMNDFASGNVITPTLSKTFGVGEEAEYELLVVNPTNKLKVYRIVLESSSDVSVRPANSVVAIPAGASKTISVFAEAEAEGEFEITANVFSGEELINTMTLNANVEGEAVGNGLSNSVVALTVILVIVFVVLLVVLIVLLGRKPEKSEEFGESYY